MYEHFPALLPNNRAILGKQTCLFPLANNHALFGKQSSQRQPPRTRHRTPTIPITLAAQQLHQTAGMATEGGASRGRRGLDGECGAGWVRSREKHGYVTVGGATVGARSRETQKYPGAFGTVDPGVPAARAA